MRTKIASVIINWYTDSMLTLTTPNATVQHIDDFTELYIELKHPQKILDLWDIKEIYAAFFRQWLHKRIDGLPPDDVINLGYYVAKEYEHSPSEIQKRAK